MTDLDVLMQMLVMRNGHLESKEETEASTLPAIWPQLPISRSCDTVVVSDVNHDDRCMFTLPMHFFPPMIPHVNIFCICSVR